MQTNPSDTESLRILCVEPFMGGSHKAFLKGLQAHSRHTIIPVTMTDKYWKWRLNGGSVTLAEKTKKIEGDIDLVLASSMTNLPAFMALTNPRFAYTPVLLYMHENQLTQPVPQGESRDQTYCYINYLSLLSATEVIFNSQFHFTSFMEALPGFLAKFPDYHQPESITAIEEKSRIVRPGLDLLVHDQYRPTQHKNRVPVIVWNQRWAFDKDPEKFFRIMNRLDDSGCEFDLILAGDNHHDKPEAFENAWKRYGRRIIHYGYLDDLETYSRLLHRGDIVVSTAQYEFSSVAIMEAIYCGCHPVLPNMLTYPELIPEHLKNPLLHAPVLYNNEEELFRILRDILTQKTKPLPESSLRNVNRHMDWKFAVRNFDDLFDETVEKHREREGTAIP